jgi:uncharacterized protein (DUF736 family)
MTKALIGRFRLAKDGGWTGEIQTLSIDARIRLAPNDNQDNERAPAFRVYRGQSHVGDAWTARTSAEPPIDYLRVQLDDPAFPEPMHAALFFASDGDHAELVWSRRRRGGDSHGH